jgi:hypothetical protein
MKTLDDIINKIHREQAEHEEKLINERNEYLEYLEELYQEETIEEIGILEIKYAPGLLS